MLVWLLDQAYPGFRAPGIGLVATLTLRFPLLGPLATLAVKGGPEGAAQRILRRRCCFRCLQHGHFRGPRLPKRLTACVSQYLIYNLVMALFRFLICIAINKSTFESPIRR